SCRRRLLPAPPAERQDETGQRNQQRNEADVEDLRPEFQRVGLHAQVLAQFLQIAPRLGRLLAEVLDLGLLLRGEYRALRAAARLLQALQLLLRLVKAVLELLDLPEIALLRAVLHRPD